MVGSGANEGGLELDTGRFVAAAVLIGAGALLLFIGAIVGSLHALSEGTRIVGRMDTPPNELAKDKMNRLTLAAKAGANAWKDYPPSSASSAKG